MENKDLIKLIEDRKKNLDNVSNVLKNKFVGIDEVIDKIINQISMWYIMPEIQIRPTIVCLWGITGIGKTDLVRTLIKELKLLDNFIEIQLDNKSEYEKTIQDYLDINDVDINSQSVLLLDEIQRFRTKENGKLLESKYFNDIWMLLSDGKFQNNTKKRNKIFELIIEEMYYNERSDDNDTPNVENNSSDTPSNKKSSKSYKYKMSYWNANRFKKLINSDLPIEEIMKFTVEEKIELANAALKNENINEGLVYNKMLIFISGNLDEAFNFSTFVEDNERDADIYYELSKKVNIIDIKSALLDKFTPEQIARFGNNHIIYPSLNKINYKKLIINSCNNIINDIKGKHNINITFSNKIYDIIYRNGVFPAQGVRPVLSTIFNLLGNNLPDFIYNALINNISDVYIDYDEDNVELFSKSNNINIRKKIILDIDDIKNKKTIDEKSAIMVHEIGHALIHTILFKVPPKQININSSSSYSNGFIITQDVYNSCDNIRNKISVFLAGSIAEEIVFGKNNRSNGNSFDMLLATDLATRFVRRFGMNGINSTIAHPNEFDGYITNNDINNTNIEIEKIISEEKSKCSSLFKQYEQAFKSLLKYISDNSEINTKHFVQICNENGIDCNINDNIVIDNYEKKLKYFIQN